MIDNAYLWVIRRMLGNTLLHSILSVGPGVSRRSVPAVLFKTRLSAFRSRSDSPCAIRRRVADAQSCKKCLSGKAQQEESSRKSHDWPPVPKSMSAINRKANSQYDDAQWIDSWRESEFSG
jgi:hypothetical protein|tara:strand:- start:364 stop:726 length:363 start_codon:yes stop_codon:yes gene_type:complete